MPGQLSTLGATCGDPRGEARAPATPAAWRGSCVCGQIPVPEPSLVRGSAKGSTEAGESEVPRAGRGVPKDGCPLGWRAGLPGRSGRGRRTDRQAPHKARPWDPALPTGGLAGHRSQHREVVTSRIQGDKGGNPLRTLCRAQEPLVNGG